MVLYNVYRGQEGGRGVPQCLNQLSQLFGPMVTVFLFFLQFSVQYSVHNSVQCTA